MTGNDGLSLIDVASDRTYDSDSTPAGHIVRCRTSLPWADSEKFCSQILYYTGYSESEPYPYPSPGMFLPYQELFRFLKVAVQKVPLVTLIPPFVQSKKSRAVIWKLLRYEYHIMKEKVFRFQYLKVFAPKNRQIHGTWQAFEF